MSDMSDMPGVPDDLGFTHRFVPASRPDASTLLLLHGTGGDEQDLLAIGRRLSDDAALLSPRGAVLEHGMPRFFRRHAEGVLDLEDLVVRVAELATFVGAAAGVYGFDPARVMAVGFSNGANAAAALHLLHPSVLRASVLLSPMVPIEPERPTDLATAAVFIGSGRADPIAPPEGAERLAGLLGAAGAAVTLDWHDGGHALDLDQLIRARSWLVALGSATGSDPARLP